MEKSSTSLTNGSGRKTRITSSSENASTRPRHHRKARIIGPSQVAFAYRGLDRLGVCELRHDASLIDRVDAVRDGAHERQVLLDDDERRIPGELPEHLLQV